MTDTQPNSSEAAPLRVLLIEDNPGDARLFEEYLAESRVDATLRHEGDLEAGLSALREGRPDVLVLDLGLPDSEGPGTVAAAMSAAPEVPIVVLTGQDDLGAALQAQQAGAAQYLQKGELTPALAGRTLRWAAQRSRMQRKLRQRDAWVRSITEGLSAGVFRAGPTGRIEYANEALADLLGVESSEELIGRDLTEFYVDPFQKGRMLVENGAESIEVELGRPDESTVVGLLSAEPAYDADGRVLHYDGTITDITERREKEHRLRVLSEAVEQAKESVLITEAEPLDEPGPRIEYVNEACEAMTGYPEEEVLGKTPRILQGPETEPEVLDSLRGALEAGEEWEGETVNYRKDGTPYRVQWNVAPVRGEEGEIEHWVSVQRDVTEERHREEQLRRAKEEAEQMNRLKSAFLANMSHEIRTPLTSILGFAEAIGKEARGASAAGEVDLAMLAQFSALIEKSGRRLMETLTSVLNLSKLEAGEMTLSTGPVDLAAEAGETVEEFRPRAEEAGIELGADLEDPTWTEVDEGGLHIVLRNLLSNAIKYTEAGGQVWVRTRMEDNLTILEVEDTGIGMDPTRTPELFEAFKQASEGTSREYEGTGLGLALVWEVLDRMDGSIEVESEQGTGSRFTVRLPRAEGSPTERPDPE